MSINRILLVEDAADDQFLAKRTLKKVNCDIEVVVAFDGLEAIELLQDGQYVPDLILLDINMPRMGGLEFLEKYASRNPQVPPVVAMLTSSDQEPDKSKSLSYECVKGYFVKPINQKDIIDFSEYLEGYLNGCEA